MNESDGITINSGRLPCLCARLYCPIPEEARSPHECLGGNHVRFASRRPHQWNHGAICEAANSAAIDDLGPPNRSIRQFGEGQRSATAKGKAEQD